MVTILVSGSGTGVGKTRVTAALARTFAREDKSVRIVKPLQTGVAAGESSDAEIAAKLAEIPSDCAHTLRRYTAALAPLDAARLEEAHLRGDALINEFFTAPKSDIVLVEGAGGIGVPVTEEGWEWTTYAGCIGADGVILVVPDILGAINQARLTYHYFLSNNGGWPPGGIFLNETARTPPAVRASTRAALAELKIPIWGELNFGSLEATLSPAFGQFLATVRPKPVPYLNSVERLNEDILRDLSERATAHRQRKLRAAEPARVNLADNDYLGLAHDETVKNAVRRALETSPVSASASPLARGYQEIHAKLEQALCDWHGFPAGLIWNSGFAANQAVLGTLAEPKHFILADRLVHHSLIAGMVKSGAKFARFPHNNLDALEALLKKNSRAGTVMWVVTESVFSMDGDSPDLARLAQLKRQHGFVWVLDEAHALGWYGPEGQGRAAEAGVAQDVDLLVGTFGKALGGMGAYTLFRNPLLREALINRAGEFIYSTYLSPLLAAAALGALGRLRALASNSAQWRERSRRFREDLRAAGWDAPAGDSPIVPVIIGGDADTVALGEFLHERGFATGAIRPPTVPEGSARLRLSLKSTTHAEDLTELLKNLNAWRRSKGVQT